jgi:predicted dehydrogenase
LSGKGVAIIGCGLIGRKRAMALGPAQLLACVDVSIDRARSLASLHPQAVATTDWKSVVKRSDIDIVIVATTNDALAEIATASIKACKHVLVEKPAARNPRELNQAIDAASHSRTLVRVGFNHRFHPAMKKVRELLDAHVLGPLMFVRARYGHGGRVGYEKEWRADPGVAGGGELIDQGVHLIDLSRWVLGDFSVVLGRADTLYWDMRVEDNAFLILRTPDKKTAFLHCSCTEWKNLFSFEIYGRAGKLHAEGLGGSYGVERLAHYKMLPEMGPPETTIWEYPSPDLSWHLEFSEFLEDIRLARQPSASLHDAQAALRVVEQIYQESSHDHHA